MDIHPEAPTVTLYSQPGCGPCIAVALSLDKNGIPFTKIDVTADFAACQHVADNLGYAGTPVVEVGDMHWQGHRSDKVARLAAILAAWQPHDGAELARQFEADNPDEYTVVDLLGTQLGGTYATLDAARKAFAEQAGAAHDIRRNGHHIPWDSTELDVAW